MLGVSIVDPIRRMAVVSHPVEPTLPLGIARSIDHPQQGFTDSDGRHAGESEDAPFQPAHPVCSEVPSVDQRRQTDRDDESRRPSRKQPSPMAGSLSIAFWTALRTASPQSQPILLDSWPLGSRR
jgi:hypothetical protein